MPRSTSGGGWASTRPPAWALGLTLLAFGATPTPARGTGEAEPSPDLSGTYRNVASDRGRSTIEAAVNRGIEDLFALARPTARSRLLESNPPIETVEIDHDPDRIRIDLGHGRDAALRPGAWGPGHSADGTTVRLRYTEISQGIKMESRSDGGAARHVFALSPDGTTLRQSVRIESSHLPDDIHYALTYRRIP